jgi:hypothetical protein
VGFADYRVWNKTDALFYPQLVTARFQLAPAGSAVLGELVSRLSKHCQTARFVKSEARSAL